MQKNVLVFGLISGLIVSAFMVFGTIMYYNNPKMEGSMVLGYASMLLAFSFIFTGIKNVRDTYNNGVISFGKAFKVGLYITLIASTMYVATWLVEYHYFVPDFMEKYTAHVLHEAKTSGISDVNYEKKLAEMARYNEWYKNPAMVILLSYMEVLPLGILVSLVSAFILARKQPKEETVAA